MTPATTPNGLWLVLSACLCVQAYGMQVEQLPHPDTTAGNFFGVAVAIEGPRALVGASGDNKCITDGGAAFVYEQDPHTQRWIQQARLEPEDCDQRRFFGRSVALSGEHALIASSNQEGLRTDPEVAYLFQRDTTGTWSQVATLSVNGDYPDRATGTRVAIHNDTAVLVTSGDTSHGRYGGAAYLYQHASATRTWELTMRITGRGDRQHGIFGGDVALNSNTLVIPSSRYLENKSGSVFVFEQQAGSTWAETSRADGIDDFFISVDVYEERFLVGESRSGPSKSGIAALYQRDQAGNWIQSEELTPPTPYRHGAFGSAVALSGDRALIVGYDEQLRLDFNIDRVVYVYALNSDTRHWNYQGIIDIGHVAFGSAVDLDGRVAIIGAASEAAPGAAYIVRIL